MMKILSHTINTVMIDPKVAWAALGTTYGAITATALEWIPSNIGEVATGIGALLSIVLIISHVTKFINDYKSRNINKIYQQQVESMSLEKHKLEMKVLQERLRILSESDSLNKGMEDD